MADHPSRLKNKKEENKQNMPVDYLTEEQGYGQLHRQALSRAARPLIAQRRKDHNRLGFAFRKSNWERWGWWSTPWSSGRLG
jgi:hypothetical protein